MLRKVGLVSTLLLALPAFAHAWTVTAKIGSGQGSVTDGTKVISLPVAAPATGSIGYYKAENVIGNSQTFTVTPAAGYSVSSVIVNGAPVANSGDGTYTIGSGSPIDNSQSLVVYFKQNLLTVAASQPDTTMGRIVLQACDSTGKTFGTRSMVSIAGLKSTGYVKVTAYPNANYKVATVAGVTAAGLQGEVVSVVVPASSNPSVTATFDLAPVVKAALSVSKSVANMGEAVKLDAGKTAANVAGVTYAFSALPATGVVITPVAGTATAYATFATAGNYTVKVVASAPGAANNEAVAVLDIAATNSCLTCHNNRNADLVARVQGGGHAYAIASGHDTNSCQRCHTTEGYQNFAKQSGVDFGGYNPVFTTITNVDAAGNKILTTVGCYACHNNHDSVLQSTPASWDPKYSAGGASASNQFKLCTSCHNVVNASGTPIASGSTVSGTATVQKTQHYKDWYRNIASTHYDLPTTGVGLTTTYVEGYNIRWNKESACTDCHGHDFNVETGASQLEAPSIQTQWAKSGHAGKLLQQKWDAFVANNATLSRTQATAAATMAAGVTGTTGAAWEHYNWDDSTGTASDRKGCQKCHTSTGSANYLDNPVAYNPANNDFSHLVGWTSTNKKSNQNELLYCWGCHKSADTGELRNPGAITTADYKFKGVNASYPDVQASNVCITCHGGQASGETITALTAAGNTFTNQSFVNSHYMAAAGLMYVKNGYTNFIDPATVIGTSTYGKSLTSDADGGALTSTHRKLGTAAIIGDHGITAEMGIAAGGPCATCHYANGNHELEIGADAFTKVCVNCHTAEGTTTLTADNFKTVFVEEQSVPFQDALSLALAKLSANYGITYNQAAYPYFYDARNNNSAVKDWTRGGQLTAAQAEKLMGACFNINLLKREPAAYVHARTYARRLLYDTIDFLDDTNINMSVGASAVAYDAVKYVKDTTAGGTTTESFKYLAGYNRTSLVWNALERP
ncbi:hypothetical protein [Geomonas ferrireducens]|uniref:hypothetical protein n=1 Tax=Geomonas ferrireducens TaxID=2570227 RepID=UPI0010A942AC|nr:hypothetical protein [Geomonas ferrireducens]